MKTENYFLALDKIQIAMNILDDVVDLIPDEDDAVLSKLASAAANIFYFVKDLAKYMEEKNNENPGS